jgi:hypothetical protein
VHIIRDAINAVQQNLLPLAIYLFVSLITGALGLGWHLLQEHGIVQLEASSLLTANLVVDLLLSVCYAATQSIVFGRMGRRIDRPLWRLADDREALRRFFSQWLVLNLILVVPIRIAEHMQEGSGEETMGISLLLLYLLLVVLVVPVGACIMFTGGFRFAGLGESLAPLGHQLPTTLVVVFVNALQIPLLMIGFDMAGNTPVGMVGWLAICVIAGYIDCVVFAATWLLCMADRDAMEDIDLDF